MTKDGDNYVVTASAASPTALESTYGVGNYVFKYTGQNDGAATVTLALPQNLYPTALRHTILQLLNRSIPVAISRYPGTPGNGGTDQDTISLSVKDGDGYEVYSTNDGELNGTSTSAVIPADTLEVKKTYTATLTFRKVVVNESLSFGLEKHLAGFYASTDIVLKTIGSEAATRTRRLPSC